MVPNGPLTDDGLVQLLTPTGERAAHPDYDPRVAHLDADALRGALPRHGAGAPVRHRGDVAAAPGRARPCTRSASARRPRRSAPAARWPRRTTCSRRYREHGVAHTPRRRPGGRAAAVPRHRPRRLGPDGAQLPPVHAGHRLAHAARDRLRDGRCSATALVGTGDPARDTAVVTYFGDGATVAGRRQRGARLRRGEQRARRASSARTTSGRSPSRPRRQSRVPLADRGPGFGIPSVRVDGNDVLATLRGDGRGARARALRRRPDVHRGVHLPHGRAHHVRRPDAATARPPRRSTGASATRSTACGCTSRPIGELPQDFLDEARRRGRRRSASASATDGPRHGPPAAGVDVRARLRDAALRRRGRARLVRGVRGRRSSTRSAGEREPPMTDHHARQGDQPRPAQGAGADPKVLLMGEDIGALGGVFRVTDGLQKDFGEDRVVDTPLAESGIVGTAIGLALRGYRPGVRDPVRRVHLPGVRPDHDASWPRCTTGRAAA